MNLVPNASETELTDAARCSEHKFGEFRPALASNDEQVVSIRDATLNLRWLCNLGLARNDGWHLVT